jgi:hypothetical protein
MRRNVEAEFAFSDHFVAGFQTIVKVSQELTRGALFCQESGHEALYQATHADPVGYCLHRESTNAIATTSERLNQALVLKTVKRKPCWRPRRSKPFCQRNLGEAFPRKKHALEDQIA